jgi:hypothetical protein
MLNSIIEAIFWSFLKTKRNHKINLDFDTLVFKYFINSVLNKLKVREGIVYLKVTFELRNKTTFSYDKYNSVFSNHL